MAVPFCEPSYHPGALRETSYHTREVRERRRQRRQVEDTTIRRQLSSGIAVSQLSLSSRVLLWGLMETWRILTNVTNEDNVEEDDDSVQEDDAEDDSELGYELIINSVTIDQPDNAILAAKEDAWIDSQVVDKGKRNFVDMTIGAPCLTKEQEILSMMFKSGFDLDQDYCCSTTDAKTSAPRSTNSAHVETVNSVQHNLQQTHSTDTVPKKIYKTFRMEPQPSHNQPVNLPSTKLPDILSHLSTSPSHNFSSTSSEYDNHPPHEGSLPDLLKGRTNHITGHLPDITTSNQGTATSTPDEPLNSIGGKHSMNCISHPAPPHKSVGGRHYRTSIPQQVGTTLLQPLLRRGDKPLRTCDMRPYKLMAKVGGESRETIKTETVESMADWREVGRSLRRTAVFLETEEGQRGERRRNSRCEYLRNQILVNQSKHCVNSKMISDLLVAFGLFGLLAIANKIENVFK